MHDDRVKVGWLATRRATLRGRNHHARQSDDDRAERGDRQRRDRHGRRRVRRRAGAAHRQAGVGAHVARRRRPRRRRGVQLPAVGRRRPQHRRRLCDVELGDRLRRHGAPSRPRDAPPHPLAAGLGPRHERPRVGARRRRRAGAAHDPEPPARTPRRARPRGLQRHRARVHRLRRFVSGCLGQGLSRTAGIHRLQRRLQPALDDAPRASAARHPQRDGRRGPVLRGREGRVQLRSAGDRLPLRGSARDRRSAHDLQERRERDRRPARQGAHLHGEVQRARGGTAATSTCRCAPPTARP